MGNNTSAFIKSIDRDKLFVATKSTRMLMDTILEYLLQKLNMKDFFVLSSPTECKKYVMALAGTLDTIFYELSIVPEAKKDGTIYFRASKDLTEPVGERQKANRQSLCVILSYFYTRIFQIFGALALSVIDEASSMIDTGLASTIKGDILRIRGAEPIDIRVKRGGATIGGNIDNLGAFSFLRDDLVKEETQYGHLFKAAPRTMSFMKKSGSVDWAAGPGTKATIYVGMKGVKNKFIEFDLTASAAGGIASNTIRLYVGDLRVAGVKYNIPSEITDKTITLEREMPGVPYTLRSDTTISAVQVIFDIAGKLVKYVEEKGYGRDESATGRDETLTSQDILAPLKVDRTMIALTRDKPLAHCIARAMQLLSARPIEGKEALSSVCKKKFLETASGTVRSGIPAPGDSIDKSPGLYALNQLFFDAVKYGLPEIGMKNNTLEQYRAFLKDMAVAFNDVGTTAPEKMSDVKSRQGCDGADMSIALKADAIPGVYTVIRKMYEVQLAHTANAGKIIGQLFLIKYDKGAEKFTFSIHPNIFKKGIIEVERINAEARGVLVNYYKSCEGLYKIGKERVMDGRVGTATAKS